MRTSILIIFTLGMFGFLSMSSLQNADALCMENQDWSDAPCYGCIGCHPGLEQEKIDWAPYYDFKGTTWMDVKKQQLEIAIHNNSLREWFEKSDTGAHRNVHQYYFLHGDAPNIYGMNFEETLGFEKSWNAVENNSNDAPMLLWNYHDIILDGTLIETDLTVTITGDHVPLYSIKVNKYFKGEKNSDMITAVENPDDLEFDLFENGLFYLKKLDSQHWYTATIASVKTFGNCDARDLIEISPVLPNEKPPRSTPVSPERLVDPCIPEYYDVDPDEITFKDELVPEPEQDRPVYENCGPDTTLQNGICIANEINENKNSSYKWGQGFTNFKIKSPLKQIKNGVALVDVQCNEGKYPAYKYNRMSMACVSEETRNELWSRGWATMRFYTEEDTSPHALCNNYEGKWHPEYEGCRGNITDLQCSLMGGEFVDNLKICHDGICPVDKTYTLCVTDLDLVTGEKQNED